MSQFVLLRATNYEMTNNQNQQLDRETISRRLNETIFDDEYLEKKAKKLTSQYKDEYGNIKGDQV